jgi:replication-associated recombination protein RarA
VSPIPVTRWHNDPWADTTSLHGIPCDELISALQKNIRRGNLDEAALVAREMFETSAELTYHLWDRLTTIACSDVTDNLFLAPVIIETLRTQCLRPDRESGDGWVYLAHAIRYLCQAPKDRTTDELCMWLVHAMDEEGRQPVIPDWALDNHTRRGQEMGRGVRYFLAEGCLVENVREDHDPTYRKRLDEIIERGDWRE